jgi:hypothetical protein
VLRAQVGDEVTVGFYAIGRFPEVGDEIENIDFFHSDEVQWNLTAGGFRGLRGAERLKQKA